MAEEPFTRRRLALMRDLVAASRAMFRQDDGALNQLLGSDVTTQDGFDGVFGGAAEAVAGTVESFDSVQRQGDAMKVLRAALVEEPGDLPVSKEDTETWADACDLIDAVRSNRPKAEQDRSFRTPEQGVAFIQTLLAMNVMLVVELADRIGQEPEQMFQVIADALAKRETID